MIDLSYKKPEIKEEEPNILIQGIIFVLFSAFLAVIVLSGIVGEPIF